MMKENIKIRAATVDDAAQLLAIYTPYVEKTAITFEYDVPSLAEFTQRIERTLQKYPYIVAEKNNHILGYAYSGTFINRAAYDWSAEVTIYLREDQRQKGLGRKLYEALENISRAQNILNLNACIAYTNAEDEYLTNNSVQFHHHLGYRMVGVFHQCGYKFGKWYDMVWMEKLLDAHPIKPSPIIAFPDLNR